MGMSLISEMTKFKINKGRVVQLQDDPSDQGQTKKG